MVNFGASSSLSSHLSDFFFCVCYINMATEFFSLTWGYQSVTHLQMQFYGPVCMILGCRLYILLHFVRCFVFYLCILLFWALKFLQMYFFICKLWSQKCFENLVSFGFHHTLMPSVWYLPSCTWGTLLPLMSVEHTPCTIFTPIINNGSSPHWLWCMIKT